MTRDPPFSRQKIAAAHLIYLDHTLQQRIISLFYYSLTPDGFLVLGPSETIGRSSEHFRLIDARHKIYRRQPAPARVVPEFLPVQVAAPAGVSETIVAATGNDRRDRAQKEKERLLLTRYAPASILIDENLNVVYFHGETSRYLKHARGAADLNLQNLPCRLTRGAFLTAHASEPRR